MDLLDRLLGHDQWATDQLLNLSQGLTESQFDQEFDIGHGTLRATFAHMIFNIEAWTAVMAGQPVERERDGRSLVALIDRHNRAYATFAALARQVRDEQRLEETFADHFDEQQRFGAGVVHVVLHNAEHRTEALHILTRLGVPDPPEIDHALWDHLVRGA
jgi:uncharacterized damage-inducible protein DinB